MFWFAFVYALKIGFIDILKVFWSSVYTFTLITIVIEHLLCQETWEIWISLAPDSHLYYFLSRITRHAICLFFLDMYQSIRFYSFFLHIFSSSNLIFPNQIKFFSCMLFPVFHCLLSYTKSGIHHNTITNHHKENKTLFFNSICISSIWLLHSAFCAKVTTFNLISKSICAPLSLPDSLHKSPSHYNYVPGSFWLPQYLCKLVFMKSSWQVSCILASFLIHLRCLLQEGGTHSKWQFNFRPIYAYLTPLSIKELYTTVFFSSSKKW